MLPANEIRRYIVKSFSVGWVHAQNDPCERCTGPATHWFLCYCGVSLLTTITLYVICYNYMTVNMHYGDVIMTVLASQITSVSIIYSTICLGADQRKHGSSVSLAFVWGIHRWPVNSPHKWPVTRKMFRFDDVIVWLRFYVGVLGDNFNQYSLEKLGCPFIHFQPVKQI